MTPVGYGIARAGFFGAPAGRATTFRMADAAIPALPARKPATMAHPATLPLGTTLSFYLAVSACTMPGMIAGRAIGGNGVPIGMPRAVLFLLPTFSRRSARVRKMARAPVDFRSGIGEHAGDE